MEVDTLIRKLECDGAVFELTGERLKLRAKRDRAPAPEELAQLQQHRTDVITFLSARAQSIEASALKVRRHTTLQATALRAEVAAIN